MANHLYNTYGRNSASNVSQSNIINQFEQLQKNPGKILDILLQNGKINRQQYNDLQIYRNDPKSIVQYLINNGNTTQINQAQQLANNFR